MLRAGNFRRMTGVGVAALCFALGGAATAGPVAGAVDSGLGRLLAAQGRPADAVARIAVAPARRNAGTATPVRLRRAVALATEWERPALLAAEVGNEWSTRALGRSVEVVTLELRDVTGDGAPEVLARLVSRSRRSEHEVVLTRLVIYQVDAAGIGAAPVFDELERVEERALPGHIGALSGSATFSIDFARGRGGRASEITVVMVSDRMDDEHEAFQSGGHNRRPGTLAGRFVWDGKRFVRRGPAARS